ncbi:hypothetical protein [Actinomadura litoris]|uniref:hypothetical protein n=1 Tax=Actinomadura litoris TaxID=2678616 RepID=UPI001FA7F96A|nr:hypothetical protein [Actinomadura litoris]
MSTPLLRVIKDLTDHATKLQEWRADADKAAAGHRSRGDYPREALSAHAADTYKTMAALNSELAEFIGGISLPDPGDVSVADGGLGFGIGHLAHWGPPPNPSMEELRRWRAFVDELVQALYRQRNATDRALRAAQATQATGQIAPEDLPQPDPLTAPVQEGTGAHPVDVVGRGMPVTPPDGTPVPEEGDPGGYPEKPAVAPVAPVAGEEPRPQLPKRVKGRAYELARAADNTAPAPVQAPHPDTSGGDAAPGGFPQDGGAEHA